MLAALALVSPMSTLHCVSEECEAQQRKAWSPRLADSATSASPAICTLGAQISANAVLPSCSGHEDGSTLRVRLGVIDSGRRRACIAQLTRDLGVELERWPAAFDPTATGCAPTKATATLAIGRQIRPSDTLVSFAHRRVMDAASHDDHANVTVVFEDDARAAVAGVQSALRSTLAGFAVTSGGWSPDIVRLGWCGDHLVRVPACLHAYALSRFGASVLHRHTTSCAHERGALDEQVAYLAAQGAVHWAVPSKRLWQDAPQHWTRGLFHQSDEHSSVVTTGLRRLNPSAPTH